MDIIYPSWTCNALLKNGVSLNTEFAEAVRDKLAELSGQWLGRPGVIAVADA